MKEEKKEYLNPKISNAIDQIKLEDSWVSISWDGLRALVFLRLHITVWIALITSGFAFYLWSLRNSAAILQLLGY